MGTFRLLALRQFAVRPGRTALAVGAIALGVALVLAIQLINRAAVAALRQTVEAAAGRAELQVVATSDAGVPEETLERVRSAPGVALAVAIVEGPVFIDDGRGEAVTVFGVDLGDEDAVRAFQGVAADAEEVIDDPLVFLAQPDSVVVTRAFAAGRRLGLGDRVAVVAPGGRRTLVVRGLLDPQGAARAFGTSLFVMDVFAAQRLFAGEGRYTHVDAVLADGAQAETVAAALRRILPPGLAVERPERRGEQVTAMLRAFQSLFFGMSCIALVVAIFIVYNSLATVVVERRTEIGILRALGARRRQILGFWLGEALATGALGAAAGTGLGLGLAHLLVDSVSRSTAIALALPPLGYRIAVGPAALAASTAAGCAASVLAALLPARSAARVAPIVAIRQEVPSAPRGWGARALAFGLVLAGVGAVALAMMRPGAVAAGYVANPALGGAVALLSVPAALLLFRALRPIATRLLGVHGQLAADASRRLPLRTATTVAALTLGLSMSAAMSIQGWSFTVSVDDWVRSWARQDLFVRSAFKERGFVQAPLPGTLASRLLAVPGVARVESFRMIRQQYRGDTIALAASSTSDVDGRRAAVSDNFALRYGTRLGGWVALETPRGRRRFRVVRVLRDYDSDRGTVTIGLGTFRRLWGDRLLTDVGIVLAAGADPTAVRADILGRFGGEYALEVLDPQAVAADVRGAVSRAFAFTRGLEAVTLLVALLGIFDTVLAGVLARRREIGLLRALGWRRRDVAAAFALEGLFLGSFAAALGLGAGFALAAIQLDVVFPNAVGYLAELHVPAGRLAMIAVAAALLALAAAIVPARRAARLPVTEALARE